VLSREEGSHPSASDSTLPNASKDPISILCNKGTFLPRVQHSVHHDPQNLFCEVAFQLGEPENVLVPGVISSQIKDFVCLLAELYEVCLFFVYGKHR